MPKQSNLQRAKYWLGTWPEKWFTPEELKKQANLNIGTPALARKLRLFRQQGELESRTREGKSYVEYRYNPERLIAKVKYRMEQDQQIQQGLF